MTQIVTIHLANTTRAYRMDEQGRRWCSGRCPEYNDRNYDVECAAEKEIEIPDDIRLYKGTLGDLCLRLPNDRTVLLDEVLTSDGQLPAGLLVYR